MKRRSFLKIPILATPLGPNAQQKNTDRPKKGFKVEAGKDRFNDKNFFTLTGGAKADCKVSSSDTNGDLYVLEAFRNTKGGPRLHFHHSQDEWLFVVEGEFRAKVGEEMFNLKPGDSLFMPRTIPHQMANVNDGPGKVIIAFQPAGKMEAFFKAISNGAFTNITEEENNKLAREYGMENVGPRTSILDNP